MSSSFFCTSANSSSSSISSNSSCRLASLALLCLNSKCCFLLLQARVCVPCGTSLHAGQPTVGVSLARTRRSDGAGPRGPS
eukprot:3390580-Heterocapsa_arctica.AAC.1